MKNKQFIEGKIRGCKSYRCECSCCDNDQVEEWVVEFFVFHERIKDYIKKLGIKIEFIGDRVRFKNCTDGKKCKFLISSLNKDIDYRPIDCKIFPFCVDWNSIDFDNKIVKLYYWDKGCPLVKSNSITKNFKQDVENIIKRDFAFLFYGARFKVKFINDIYKN